MILYYVLRDARIVYSPKINDMLSAKQFAKAELLRYPKSVIIVVQVIEVHANALG